MESMHSVNVRFIVQNFSSFRCLKVAISLKIFNLCVWPKKIKRKLSPIFQF